MVLLVTIVKDIHALTNVTKISILDVAESLDLLNGKKRTYIMKIPATFYCTFVKVCNAFCYHHSADVYLFKVNYKNTRTRREMFSKLIIKTPEPPQ